MPKSHSFQRLVLAFLLLFGACLAAAGAARADTCTCNIDVLSSYRWMDPWWGLECNGHCGHGYVGASCDTAHGAGCGAMTGYVKLRFSNGNQIKNRNCPDDHRTCFRGPSGCDDGGSWGNVCSADIWRCVSGGESGGAWECNGLADGGLVWQLSATGVTFGGACGSNWFNVLEYIVEHDPWCCDDPMGFVNVSMYTANGTRTTYLSGSDENCNGGSQGGVYPHCGKFGATLAVVTSCYTTTSSGGGGGGGGGGEGEPLPEARMSEPIGAKAQSGPGAALDQARRSSAEALAASLDRRETRLSTVAREEVAQQVAERAYRLGVEAPVTDLMELLAEAETTRLALDRCAVEQGVVETGGDSGACGPIEADLRGVEDRFLLLAGWSIDEFRSGQPLYRPVPPPAAPEAWPSQARPLHRQ